MPAADPSPAAGLGARLRELGLSLPAAPTPLGGYARASQAGPVLFISGTLPLVNGALSATGRLGDTLTVEQGYEAARIAALNALANAQEHLGDLNRVKKLAKLNIYLATTEQFTEHAAVADGASDLFALIFGKENGHARMVSGVQSLPKGTPVVVETVFELEASLITQSPGG